MDKQRNNTQICYEQRQTKPNTHRERQTQQQHEIAKEKPNDQERNIEQETNCRKHTDKIETLSLSLPLFECVQHTGPTENEPTVRNNEINNEKDRERERDSPRRFFSPPPEIHIKQ